MENTTTTLYVFPDTNVLVQCKSLGELAWSYLGSYSKIILILSRPVIGEIDKQKGLPGRLGKRAREVNPLLRRFLSEDYIDIETKKKDVLVQVVSGDHLRASPELDGQLDYSTVDGTLVGTVHKYQADNPYHNVLFLSHDTGPLMTAKRVGVPFCLVPDDWTLSAESDEQAKEIRALKEELKLLEDRNPKCEINFADSPSDFTIYQYSALTSQQVERLVAGFTQMYPLALEFEVSQTARKSYESMLAHLETRRFIPVTEKEINSYRSSYDAWVNKLRKFFQTLHIQRNARVPNPRLSIKLANIGSCPATNVEVRIEVAGGKFGLRVPQELPEDNLMLVESIPQPPTVPKGHWCSQLSIGTPLSAFLETSSRLADIESLFRIQGVRDINTFYWKNGAPSETTKMVQRECVEWRHQDAAEALTLELVPNQLDTYVKDAVKVIVHANNLSKPIQAIQPVRLSVEKLDLWPEAEAQFGA